MVFKKLYPTEYTANVSTRVSNSLLVGESSRFSSSRAVALTDFSQGAILGQIVVGVICDKIGRKAALVITTLLIVLGATLGTAAHGAGGRVQGLFWFLTFARYLFSNL